MKNEMHDRIKVAGDVKFEGFRLDMCANRSSEMSIGQDIAYCNLFGLPLSIDTKATKTIIGVGEDRAL